MSARERNRARRKAKMAARKNTREKEQEDPWYVRTQWCGNSQSYRTLSDTSSECPVN